MWTIVHYEGVRISLDDYKAVRWSVVVLDEAHFIKNRTTKRTKAIVEVTPTLAYRIELTATPYGRNPADFWSQLRWIAPLNTALGSYWKFYEMFVDYEMDRASNGAMYRKVKGGKNLEQLARLMNGFGLRRTKKMVAPELPPITDTYMPLELEGRQATMYQKLCDTTKVEYQTANGDALSIPNTLARMTRLEQLLSHPWTFDAAVQGAKLEWVKEWAEGCSTPTVIATRFKASAHRLARELGCKSAITGDIPPILRNAILQRWLKGEEQFVVGTIDTIGTGLNLTPAHTLILYDSMYDPIRMEQTRERVHRITTDHPVEVIYLYVPGTTNEVVLRAFIERWQQIELVRRFLYYLQKGVIDDAS
jgi:SNF2 family DNA or RNA helicase